jgi:branched-chain amino acid transport system substrate-binding protein
VGRYAVLGNAFYEAVLLARDAANRETGRDFQLTLEDTGGDPVIGALAARRLCRETGSIALLGALMSAPTASAAVVADAYGVPLVSPTATNDRIWELGKGIFQTNLTGLYEVRLMAQLATTLLLKERFAIFYPEGPEGRRHAELFRAEVQAHGGQIVAELSFSQQVTDFRRPLLEIRPHRPEVIFIPATVDQMILLGPQLDFYHAGSLVLGLSNWNSKRLNERAGQVLERALFPHDLALFPAHWTEEFSAGWPADNYPDEATALALKAYQATRMLLDTLHQSGAANRAQLAAALQNRLANRDIETGGPESYATAVRMFSAGQIVPFPAGIFAEAWDLTDGVVAVADSLVVENLAEEDEEIRKMVESAQDTSAVGQDW